MYCTYPITSDVVWCNGCDFRLYYTRGNVATVTKVLLGDVSRLTAASPFAIRGRLR